MKQNETNILDKIEYKKQRLSILAEVIQYCVDSKKYYENCASSESTEYSTFLQAKIKAMDEIIILLEKEV